MFLLTLKSYKWPFCLWTGFQMKTTVCFVIRKHQPAASPERLSCLSLCFYKVEKFSFVLHKTPGLPSCMLKPTQHRTTPPLSTHLNSAMQPLPSLPVTRRVRTLVFSLRMFTVTFLADWKYSGLPWNETMRANTWDGGSCPRPASLRHPELCLLLLGCC